MISAIISRLVILVFGTLYPAYASYKAVKTKNVKEYVKWMMYWIVFALFTCAETVTDVLLNWLPFYYEIKIIMVVWLLSPATKGSSILYRKFVHPTLSNREQEIDDYINKAKEQSYKQFLDLGSKGVSALMQTAIRGGGGLVNQLKKSYSLGDLSNQEQVDGRLELQETRLLSKRDQQSTTFYYSQMDLSAHMEEDVNPDDVGYSSGEGLPPKLQTRQGLSRAASLTRKTAPSTRVTRSSRRSVNSDGVDDIEVSKTQMLTAQEASEEDFLDCLDVHDSTITTTTTTKSPSLVTACKEVAIRGGRYHKKLAPKPPEVSARSSAIKATLVLKPGVVRSVAPEKEIFIQSPKPKRKSANNLSRLMSLPKKIHLWNKKPEKRASWHEINDNKRSLEVVNETAIFKSRSDNDLIGGDKKASDRMSVASMVDSPMAKRRLRIIRRYVDDDID